MAAHLGRGARGAATHARSSRALPLLPLGECMGTNLGWQPLGYLFDIGFTRDVWMHRVDIARATGRLELTAGHDGRVVADVLAEWASRHGEPFNLRVTGPAGGHFEAGGGGGEATTVDAVEFARILSGRADAPGCCGTSFRSDLLPYQPGRCPHDQRQQHPNDQRPGHAQHALPPRPTEEVFLVIANIPIQAVRPASDIE